MKKLNKFIYYFMMVLGILTIITISLFILTFTMSAINYSKIANVLIELNIYSFFSQVQSNLTSVFLPLIFIVILIAMPYLIVSIFIAIIFIINYIKYKKEKRNKIIKTIILFILILLLLAYGLHLLPLTNQYEIKVNSYASQYSNSAVRQFLLKELDDDYYVYKVEIRQAFLGDYNLDIYYRDNNETKIESAFLSDSNYDFVESNAEDLTDSLTVKSILLMLLGDALYIYFLVYILKEFKRITE